jgi:hypothetical protein
LDTVGTIIVFPTSGFSKTGETGKRTTIGKKEKIGVFGAIDPDHNMKDRNYGKKGNINTSRNLK